MVNINSFLKKDLINICRSRNYTNISVKNKSELCKLLQKGGYYKDKHESFEKLFLILLGNENSNLKNLYLDYKEINYLHFIHYLLNKSKLDIQDIEKIIEIHDKKVKVLVYLLLKFFGYSNLEKLKDSIGPTNLNSLDFSDEFKNVFIRSNIIKNLDELKIRINNLNENQKKIIHEMDKIKIAESNQNNITNENIQNFLRNILNNQNLNFNFGMITPIIISINNNYLNNFIEVVSENNLLEIINYIPESGILSLNSLAFSIFTGKVHYVKLLLEKGVDFRIVYNPKEISKNLVNYKADAMTFTLLMYYNLIQNPNDFKVEREKLVNIINILLPYYNEKKNVNLLGRKSKSIITPSSLIKGVKSMRSISSKDILEQFIINNKIPNNLKSEIKQINESLETRKKDIKNKTFTTRKLFRKNKITQNSETDPLLVGGNINKFDIGMEFGLLSTGLLGLFLGCGISTMGLCSLIIILIIGLGTFTIGLTVSTRTKRIKKKIIINIIKYFEYNIIDNSIINNFKSNEKILNISFNTNRLSDIYLEISRSKYLSNLMSYNDQKALSIIKLTSRILTYYKIKREMSNYLRHIKNDDLNVLNIFGNSEESPKALGFENKKRYFLNKGVNFKYFSNFKKLYSNNKNAMNNYKKLILKDNSNVVLENNKKNNLYEAQYRSFDIFVTALLSLKEKKNMSFFEYFMICENIKITKNINNYYIKLKKIMDEFLLKYKKENNKEYKFTKKYEKTLKNNIENFYKLLSNYEDDDTKYNLIQVRFKDLLNWKQKENINQFINEILTYHKSNKYNEFENKILDLNLEKKKRMENFIDFFIEKAFDTNGEIDSAFKYYILKFPKKFNKNNKKESILNMYKDLHEKAGLYYRWMTILDYYANINKKINNLEFVTRSIYYNSGWIKYHDFNISFYKNNNSNNIDKFYVLTNDFSDKYQPNSTEINNLVIFTDEDTMMKKYETRLIYFYCNYIEKKFYNNSSLGPINEIYN